MEAKDIALLIVGGIIGFLASILANLSTPSLSQAVNRRRARVIERNHSRALKDYSALKSLHEGKVDKSLYFVNWLVHIVVLLFVATTLMMMAIDTRASLLGLILLLVAMFTVVYVYTYTRRLERWRNRLDNLDQYAAELVEQGIDIGSSASREGSNKK